MSVTSEQIRSLFLHPKPTYSPAETAALLGMHLREVRDWMAAGELEGVDGDGGVVLPWSELVSFGMDFWSQEAVEEALGPEVAGVLPELLRLADLEVRIPRMEVVTLERLAAREAASVSTVLARELRDLVSVHSEWLSREVPGFAAALAWPEWPVLSPRPAGGGPAGPAAGPSPLGASPQPVCAPMRDTATIH